MVESGKSAEVVMSKNPIRMTKSVFFLMPVLFVTLILIPSVCFSQILENLEIIFQRTYVNLAPPDSLWDWGISIDCAGDVNDDGYDDIIVAANRLVDTSMEPYFGKGYVFLGGSPIDTMPDLILTGSKYGSGWIRVAGIGDFNSDGYDDVIMAQGSGERAVKVFFGGDPMDTIPDVILETRPGESVATAVAGAGDINGDSIDDCIVGDYLWAGTDGRALIFFGGTPPDSQPDVVLNAHDTEGMGISVGGGGDLNGDGFDDVVVGADGNSDVVFWAGKVYGFFGGSPMDTIADVWVRGEGGSQHLGWFGVDIVKHDSAHDWLVAGSIFYPDGFGTASPGKIYVMYGDSSMDTLVDAYMLGRTDSSRLGANTSYAGDVDRSGMGDIVSGATLEYKSRGTMYLWLGGMPLDTVPDAYARGEFEGQQPAWMTSTAGDVDNDGYDEIMFSNYAAPISEHTVWVTRYKETGIVEGYRTRNSSVTAHVFQCYPNPFSRETLIYLRLSGSHRAILEIYDARGSLVRTIPLPGNAQGSSGAFTVRWDGRDDRDLPVPSGVYFVRLDLPEQDARSMQARKIVLIR